MTAGAGADGVPALLFCVGIREGSSMAGSITKLVQRMRYWCDEANLGYC